jgi:phage shock protein A
MFKTLTTLVRGAAAEADEAIFDANATRLLAQQLRDAAESMEHAKRELALAMAHRASEQRAIEAVDQRKTYLEQGAIDAINGRCDDLANEAATMIAALEDERRERVEAMARFDIEIQRLQQLTETGRRRLTDLRRGLEMARAQEALRRAGANGRKALSTGTGALRDAESTLAKIRTTNQRSDDEHRALEDLEHVQSGRDLDARLADAGFGPNLKTKTSDVLARLQRSAANRAQPLPTPTTVSPPKDTP